MGWGANDFNFGNLGMTTAAGNTQPIGLGGPAIAPVDLSSPISGYGALTGVSRGSLGLPEVAAGGGAAGGVGGGGLFGGMTGMDKLSAGLRGLESLAGLYMGMKQLGLAKKQFKFTKEVTNTNLNNSIKSYNTALSDRARARGFTEGQSQSQIDSYTRDNSLSRSK